MEKKSSETSKSIFKNVLYGFSTWILPLGLSFIATPIIVKSLGNEDYGIYALILGFIGYSFNFNLGRAITKYIAEYRAKGELTKINDVISSTLILNLIVGMTGVLTICLLADWLVKDIFQIEVNSQSKTITAFYIASAIVFITTLNQVFNSILQGLQRFDTFSKIYNISSFAILIGNILLALNGFGLIALLLWNFIVISLIFIILVITTKRVLPRLRLSSTINKEILKLILKFSIGIIGYQILSNFLLLFERGWVIRQLGEESLTFYVVPLVLAIYIHSFIASLLLVIFPLASELDQDRVKLKKLYLKATKIVCFLVIFLGTTLVVESRLFLSLWMGSEFAEKSWLLLILHTITFSIVAIQIVSWQTTEGLGYSNYNFFIFIFCLVIGLFGMIYLTPVYGSVGVAIGRLAGFGILFFSVFYIEKWFFNKIQTSFWLKIIGTLGLSAILAGITEWYLLSKLTESWLALFFITFCGGLVYCIVLWLLGFIAEDDKQLIKGIISR